jgi:hypothetical protein
LDRYTNENENHIAKINELTEKTNELEKTITALKEEITNIDLNNEK